MSVGLRNIVFVDVAVLDFGSMLSNAGHRLLLQSGERSKGACENVLQGRSIQFATLAPRTVIDTIARPVAGAHTQARLTGASRTAVTATTTDATERPSQSFIS